MEESRGRVNVGRKGEEGGSSRSVWVGGGRLRWRNLRKEA